MKTWLDFFYEIKKLKLPEQAHMCYLDYNNNDTSIPNMDSSNMISMTRDAIEIFVDFNVPSLFRAHEQ